MTEPWLLLSVLQVIDSMAPGSAKVLDQVLKLIDAYDLYGSVAYPKRHTQDDISDIYLLPAATRGVFVNIALQVQYDHCPVLMLPARWLLGRACVWQTVSAACPWHATPHSPTAAAVGSILSIVCW